MDGILPRHVKHLTTTRTLSRASADAWAAPRDDLMVLEERQDDGTLAALDGPWRHWSRRVTIEPVGPGDDDETVRLTEEVRFASAIPVFGPAFVPLITSSLRRGPMRPGKVPWWSPPARMDPESVSALTAACLIGICAGFLSTVVTRVLTFAADDFGITTTGPQSTALAVIRSGVVITLAIMALADRQGRRRLALGSLWVAACACALCAFSPGLGAFTGAQVLTRNLSGAAVLLANVLVAEEVPSRVRAYSVGLQSMSFALGAGLVLVLLPLADLGLWGWRLVCAGAVLLVPLVMAVARHLPESKRFETAHVDPATAPRERFSMRRLWVLVALALAINVFAAPATQLQADFLKTDRGFSALWVTLFIIGTNTPAGLGVVLGGRWGDSWGRKPVAAIGMVGYATTAVMFMVSGVPMWLASLFSAVVGGLAVATIGVYGPEMFPTARRGLANGLLSAAALAGGLVGLLLAGQLADTWGYGPTFALLAIGPLLAAAIVLTLLPETAGVSLEELNRDPSAAPPS
ncbi:MAG: MFS transporter [Candidatus Microthrix sp.]|mgnify:FL=1|nr:MFS transporter [Candidatus Microthrix sp.]